MSIVQTKDLAMMAKTIFVFLSMKTNPVPNLKQAEEDFNNVEYARGFTSAVTMFCRAAGTPAFYEDAHATMISNMLTTMATKHDIVTLMTNYEKEESNG